MERLLASYRPAIRGKKWLNVSVVAAWRLYCAVHGSNEIEHLDFRRDVTLCLLKAARPQSTPVRSQPVDQLQGGLWSFITNGSRAAKDVAVSAARTLELCAVFVVFAYMNVLYGLS